MRIGLLLLSRLARNLGEDPHPNPTTIDGAVPVLAQPRFFVVILIQECLFLTLQGVYFDCYTHGWGTHPAQTRKGACARLTL